MVDSYKGTAMAQATSKSSAKPETYKNYIGGRWVKPASGAMMENRNPADTRDVVGLFPASNAEDVEAAVDAAREAFPKWQATPAPRRAERRFRLGQILIERKEQFAHDMTREMGKVLKEPRGDVQEAIDMPFTPQARGGGCMVIPRLRNYLTKWPCA